MCEAVKIYDKIEKILDPKFIGIFAVNTICMYVHLLLSLTLLM